MMSKDRRIRVRIVDGVLSIGLGVFSTVNTFNTIRWQMYVCQDICNVTMVDTR